RKAVIVHIYRTRTRNLRFSQVPQYKSSAVAKETILEIELIPIGCKNLGTVRDWNIFLCCLPVFLCNRGIFPSFPLQFSSFSTGKFIPG
ncbi:unnamed protein product, partial [Linum tenue]